MRRTSFLAHEQLVGSGRAETLKEKVYALIEKYPNITQREITEAYGESCRKRVGDLLNEKRVYATGTKKIDNLTYTTYCVSKVIQQRLFA